VVESIGIRKTFEKNWTSWVVVYLSPLTPRRNIRRWKYKTNFTTWNWKKIKNQFPLRNH
jgi:hypothetical protein